MQADRIPCIVPGCGRTASEEWAGSEILCADHWRMTPRAWRKRYRLIRRRITKYGPTPQLLDLEAKMWGRLKAKAIETAMGISA